jgi:hypothetical protein
LQVSPHREKVRRLLIRHSLTHDNSMQAQESAIDNKVITTLLMPAAWWTCCYSWLVLQLLVPRMMMMSSTSPWSISISHGNNGEIMNGPYRDLRTYM